MVTNDGKIKITGKAKKGVTVPFTIEGPVSLTDKGQIRLELAEMKVAHLPKGLSQFLGIDPEKLAGDGTQLRTGAIGRMVQVEGCVWGDGIRATRCHFQW